MQETQSWLTTLETEDPEGGYALALKLSRMAIKLTQPSAEVRDELRAKYERDTTQLISIAHVVAVNFQTVAAANGYWLHRADRG